MQITEEIMWTVRNMHTYATLYIIWEMRVTQIYKSDTTLCLCQWAQPKSPYCDQALQEYNRGWGPSERECSVVKRTTERILSAWDTASAPWMCPLFPLIATRAGILISRATALLVHHKAHCPWKAQLRQPHHYRGNEGFWVREPGLTEDLWTDSSTLRLHFLFCEENY